MIEQFQIGDIITRIGFPEQWLVNFMDPYYYYLFDLADVVNPGLSLKEATFRKKTCHAEFILVGKWDFAGRRMKDD